MLHLIFRKSRIESSHESEFYCKYDSKQMRRGDDSYRLTLGKGDTPFYFAYTPPFLQALGFLSTNSKERGRQKLCLLCELLFLR